ncbi:hypothetical protein [Intestinimonas butyriciproducens]|nr:hypothetical protein [Intestinimonas butyriciproducens]
MTSMALSPSSATVASTASKMAVRSGCPPKKASASAVIPPTAGR